MKKMLLAIIVATALSACTTAGPFVTDISSDGVNGLNITKCSVKLNAFTGTVTNDGCLAQSIRLHQ